MTEQQIEQAARNICYARGIDPDGVAYTQHLGFREPGYDVLNWVAYIGVVTEELNKYLARKEVMAAMRGGESF